MSDDYGVLDIEYVGEPWEGGLLCVGWRDRALPPPRPTDCGEYDLAWLAMLDELADPTITKVVFTKADHRYLRLAGFDVRGPIVDVQVLAWVINETTDLDLESCALRYSGVTMDKRIARRGGALYFRLDDGTETPLQDAPIGQLLAYNERDLAATETLMLDLMEGLEFDGMVDYWRTDALPLTPVLVDMEVHGVPVDMERSERLRIALEGEMETLDEELHEEAGLPEDFNLGSNKQLGAYLYQDAFQVKATLPIDAALAGALKSVPRAERAAYVNAGGTMPGGFTVGKVGRVYVHGSYELPGLGLKVYARTDGGDPSVASKVLRVHYGDRPWVARLLELKKRETIVETFLRSFRDKAHEGRLYGRFNQTGTKTGRLSSQTPNLQNIPSRGDLGHAVRELFRPEPGYVFIHGDYSMLEPRLMAHFSQDPVLLDIFRAGKDIYLETANLVLGGTFTKADRERALFKTYILAMGYGAGAEKLATTLAEAGFPTPRREVERTLAGLKDVYARFFAWKEEVIGEASEERYVETLSGHRRRLGAERGAESWRDIGTGERQSVNAVIQGSAADIVARTMVNVDAAWGKELMTLVQVHDELLWEARRGVHLREPGLLHDIQRLAQTGHGFNLSVPLIFEPRLVGSWAEGKD